MGKDNIVETEQTAVATETDAVAAAEAPAVESPETVPVPEAPETVGAAPRPEPQDEIDALRNEPEPVEMRGVIFNVCAVPMDMIPELQDKLKVIDGVSTDDGAIVPAEAIHAMAEIARMGLERHHPHLSVDRLKKMPIGCFPKILMATLNLNDFFDEMKTISKIAEETIRSKAG